MHLSLDCAPVTFDGFTRCRPPIRLPGNQRSEATAFATVPVQVAPLLCLSKVPHPIASARLTHCRPPVLRFEPCLSKSLRKSLRKLVTTVSVDVIGPCHCNSHVIRLIISGKDLRFRGTPTTKSIVKIEHRRTKEIGKEHYRIPEHLGWP